MVISEGVGPIQKKQKSIQIKDFLQTVETHSGMYGVH